MLSRPQIILLQRAKTEAHLADDEYRQALELVSGLPGCRSSKDERLSHEHLDRFLAYFETIYWNEVRSGRLKHVFKPTSVFRKPGFWAAKNTKESTSRDRFSSHSLADQIAQAESDLAKLGFNSGYCRAIRSKIGFGNDWKYLGALNRTLASKGQASAPAPADEDPF